MSFMHLGTISAASAAGDEVTLSGGFVIAVGTSSALAGWRFTNIGTVFRNSNGFLTQVNTNTDWIFPRGTFDNTDYEIRVNRTSGNSTLNGNSLNTWIVLNLSREWIVSCNAFCIESNSFIMDIRFQDGSNTIINSETSLFDSANVMASAIYTASVDAGSF